MGAMEQVLGEYMDQVSNPEKTYAEIMSDISKNALRELTYDTKDLSVGAAQCHLTEDNIGDDKYADSYKLFPDYRKSIKSCLSANDDFTFDKTCNRIRQTRRESSLNNAFDIDRLSSFFDSADEYDKEYLYSIVEDIKNLMLKYLESYLCAMHCDSFIHRSGNTSDDSIDLSPAIYTIIRSNYRNLVNLIRQYLGSRYIDNISIYDIIDILRCKLPNKSDKKEIKERYIKFAPKHVIEYTFNAKFLRQCCDDNIENGWQAYIDYLKSNPKQIRAKYRDVSYLSFKDFILNRFIDTAESYADIIGDIESVYRDKPLRHDSKGFEPHDMNYKYINSVPNNYNLYKSLGFYKGLFGRLFWEYGKCIEIVSQPEGYPCLLSAGNRNAIDLVKQMFYTIGINRFDMLYKLKYKWYYDKFLCENFWDLYESWDYNTCELISLPLSLFYRYTCLFTERCSQENLSELLGNEKLVTNLHVDGVSIYKYFMPFGEKELYNNEQEPILIFTDIYELFSRIYTGEKDSVVPKDLVTKLLNYDKDKSAKNNVFDIYDITRLTKTLNMFRVTKFTEDDIMQMSEYIAKNIEDNVLLQCLMRHPKDVITILSYLNRLVPYIVKYYFEFLNKNKRLLVYALDNNIVIDYELLAMLTLGEGLYNLLFINDIDDSGDGDGSGSGNGGGNSNNQDNKDNPEDKSENKSEDSKSKDEGSNEDNESKDEGSDKGSKDESGEQGESDGQPEDKSNESKQGQNNSNGQSKDNSNGLGKQNNSNGQPEDNFNKSGREQNDTWDELKQLEQELEEQDEQGEPVDKDARYEGYGIEDTECEEDEDEDDYDYDEDDDDTDCMVKAINLLNGH